MSATRASEGRPGWLSLAATPVFAGMALLTAAHVGGPADLLCSAAPGGSMLGGMAPMYGLMSLFHCAPWVGLISRRHPAPLPAGHS